MCKLFKKIFKLIIKEKIYKLFEKMCKLIKKKMCKMKEIEKIIKKVRIEIIRDDL